MNNFSPGTPTPIRQSTEVYNVNGKPRPDFRNPGQVSEAMLPAYGAAIRGSDARPVHSQADVDRAIAVKASRDVRGQALDHEATLSLRVEVAALSASLADMRKRSAAQATQLADALLEIVALQEAANAAQAGAMSLA